MWLSMGPSFLNQTMGIRWIYPLDVIFIEVCLRGLKYIMNFNEIVR